VQECEIVNQKTYNGRAEFFEKNPDLKELIKSDIVEPISEELGKSDPIVAALHADFRKFHIERKPGTSLMVPELTKEDLKFFPESMVHEALLSAEAKLKRLTVLSASFGDLAVAEMSRPPSLPA